MKKITVLLLASLFALPALAQVEEEEQEQNLPDTTKVNIGGAQVIIIQNGEDDIDIEFDEGMEESCSSKKSKAHWSGVELGWTTLMNSDFNNNFDDNPYWENDPARSVLWNWNVFDHKFNFGTPHVGLTTGLGFTFADFAIKNDYLITENADSVFGYIDTTATYSKNKLKAFYLNLPLLLEFNTSAKESKNFYIATGVIGGVRIGSKTKRIGEYEGREFKEKTKGTYGLNSFKLDAHLRMGYKNFGVFANYALIPLFETGKTVTVNPFTFGISLNF